MARVTTFQAEYGVSIQIKEVWHKFSCQIGVEVLPEDDPNEIKEKCWNTVILEVEKQVKEVVHHA